MKGSRDIKGTIKVRDSITYPLFLPANPKLKQQFSLKLSSHLPLKLITI
jgi:hypothetical protein